MNGRFPVDVFLIIFLPICAISIYVFLGPLLIAQHVHHRPAVFVAVGLAAIGVLGALILWIRHKRRSGA
jgi:threonine/homoserine efflux transporter RhtA